MRGRTKGYKMSSAQKLAISQARKGHQHSDETKTKIGFGNKGKVRTKEQRENQSRKMVGLKESQARHWLGDNVGMVGIHLWLRRNYGNPKKCENCKTTDENKTYDWASKDHKYKRERSTFMRLCRSCHRKYDVKHNGYNPIKNLTN